MASFEQDYHLTVQSTRVAQVNCPVVRRVSKLRCVQIEASKEQSRYVPKRAGSRLVNAHESIILQLPVHQVEPTSV